MVLLSSFKTTCFVKILFWDYCYGPFEHVWNCYSSNYSVEHITNESFADRNALCMGRCWRESGLEVWLSFKKVTNFHRYKLLKFVGNFSGNGSVEKATTGHAMYQPGGDALHSVPVRDHWEHFPHRNTVKTHQGNSTERMPIFQGTEKIECFFSMHVNPRR